MLGAAITTAYFLTQKPANPDECILEFMPGTGDSLAARRITQACNNLYGEKQKKTLFDDPFKGAVDPFAVKQ